MNIDIHARHTPLTADIEDLARRRFGFALARFAHRIERVTVRLDDENGPKGGNDMHCVVQVELIPTGTVVVRGTYPSPEHAICTAAERLRHCLLRQFQRTSNDHRHVALSAT